MIAKNKIDLIRKIIGESKKIAVVSHVNPDGDNLGSLLAIGLSLEISGKEVKFVKADTIPDSYMFLPNIEKIEAIEENNNKIDLLIVLDCSDIERLGENKSLIEKSDMVINIDHHISNTEFGDVNIVIPEISSTGEIVYYILEKLNYPINKDIATLIYVAISTDTGRFTYQGVTGKTHNTIAKLYNYGIDSFDINKNLYQNRSLPQTQLFIKSISQMNFHNNKRIGVVKISQKMIDEVDGKSEDSEGIVEFIRDTNSIEAAAVIKEVNNNIVKISLRTKEKIDANLICSAFNGGGHSRASGATVEASLEDAEYKLIAEINKYL